MFSLFKSKKNSTEKNSAEDNSKTESWTSKIRQGLARTRQNFGKQLSSLLSSRKIDEALYDELETILLTADTGVNATNLLLEALRKKVKRDALSNAEQLKEALQETLVNLLAPLAQPLDVTTKKPFIIMITGVNGVGKTTTIGKLAHYFQSQGKSVLLAAGVPVQAGCAPFSSHAPISGLRAVPV